MTGEARDHRRSDQRHGRAQAYIDDHEDERLDPERFNVLKADRGLTQHLLWHNTDLPGGRQGDPVGLLK